jgi:septal ring factor EnvC (AmiA/AmiB activator)
MSSFSGYTSGAAPLCMNCLNHSLRTENYQLRQACRYYTDDRNRRIEELNEANRRIEEADENNRRCEQQVHSLEQQVHNLEQHIHDLEESRRETDLIAKMQKDVIEHQSEYIQAIIANGNGAAIQDSENTHFVPEHVPGSETLSTQQLMDFSECEIGPSPKRQKAED